MTAFVIDIARDRVTVAADSLGYIVEATPRPLGFASKLFAIPHHRAILCGIGLQDIVMRAAYGLCASPELLSIDHVIEALPARLRAITEDHAERIGVDAADTVMCEAFLIAYDMQQRRPRVVCMRNYEGFEPEELPAGATGLLVMPTLPADLAARIPAAGATTADRRIVAGMMAAKAMLAERDVPVGGEIIAAEVSASGVAMRSIHRFETYEQDRVAGAAVAARIIRGDDEPVPADGLYRLDELTVNDPHAAQMSRAERRRAEKLARRADRARRSAA